MNTYWTDINFCVFRRHNIHVYTGRNINLHADIDIEQSNKLLSNIRL